MSAGTDGGDLTLGKISACYFDLMCREMFNYMWLQCNYYGKCASQDWR